MQKILINAYACSPGMGSEPGMAWNWVVNLAKFCELYIITEGEFRDHIEEAMQGLEQAKNMHFFYNPVSDRIRKMCWNQGDWRFYKYYKEWQWKTYLIAKKICEEQQIDVLHQLNMTGFREPGYLWKLSKEIDIPFVWGPIGGLKQFPVSYLKGRSWKIQLFMRLKNFLNVWQLKYNRRVDQALKTASMLISTIPDSHHVLKKYKGVDSVVIPETGCFYSGTFSKAHFEEEEFHVMWAGKFDFRKQLPLALQVIAYADNPHVVLDVYGGENETHIDAAKKMAEDLGIANKVVWHGKQSNETVLEAMRKSHLFLFTSVSEETSTVILEAVSNHLPVLCFDTCGMSVVINDAIGRKVALTNPEQSILDFAMLLNDLEKDRGQLRQMAKNCEDRQVELSWEEKTRKIVEIYRQVAVRQSECYMDPELLESEISSNHTENDYVATKELKLAMQ